MALGDRPYVGTWGLNQKEVVRVTPDALVYVNGDTAIPGCPTCGGRIDLQPFITQVSVDPTTQPPATANITLQIPKHYGDSFYRDGRFLLQTGLEINIYMRGYFPVKGILDSVEEGGVDFTNAVMYPYYHVFHGVVTEVSHEYSGGEHTASLSCSDLLHFWSYQRMSTSASIFGARPSNSQANTTLTGHAYNAMTPYALVYNLWRDVAGAAGGVEFALGNENNAAAVSTSGLPESIWSFAIRYWETRFSQGMASLRMYGVDGSLYNSFEQAFLGTLSSKQAAKLSRISLKGNWESAAATDPFVGVFNQLVENGLVGRGIITAGDWAQESEKAVADKKLSINISQMHAFVHDISQWGSVNFWESQYETKLDILNTVCKVAGFEFYQDVDGDFVFKPPFYNLNTKDAPAYVIRPVDIITISHKESEPEATVVKGTGSWFKNLGGMGMEGEWGTRAEFIDYRLVAKYGWRQQTFETAYLTDPRAMYFSAINRLDLFNIGINSASVQIPIRPELRPGYPIYLEHLDCYYYLQSFNHSFSFGGQCTTTLNLVGRRAKFYAPGTPPADGSRPDITNINLSNTTLPTLPLQVEDSGFRRLSGFPNVVMALDPELINPLFYIAGATLESLDTAEDIGTLIRALRAGPRPIISLSEEATGENEEDKWLTGPFILGTGTDATVELGTVDTILANKEQATTLLEASKSLVSSDIPDGQRTRNWLDLLYDLKAKFNPGGSLPGYYRYYSASHPDKEQQGQKEILADEETGDKTTTGSEHAVAATTRGYLNLKGSVEFGTVDVKAGLPIMLPGDSQFTPTSTDQVTTVTFAQHILRKRGQRPLLRGGKSGNYSTDIIVQIIWPRLTFASETPGTVDTVFGDLVEEFDAAIQAAAERLDQDPPILPTQDGDEIVDPSTDEGAEDLGLIMNDIAQDVARTAVTLFAEAHLTLEGVYGPPSAKFSRQGEELSDLEEKLRAYNDLDAAWMAMLDDMGTLDGSGSELASDGDGGHVEYETIYFDHPYYSPVFPVSDADGFEVAGTYRYGRGLTVEPGGSFEKLNQTEGFEFSSAAAVENYLNGLTLPPPSSIAEAGHLAYLAEQASAATQATIDLTGTAFGSVIDNKLMARQASTNQTTQKVTAVNAAYSLADLSTYVTNEVCACRGAEADILLMAFGTDTTFVSVDHTEEVNSWLQEQMVAKSSAWKTSQDALRGSVTTSTSIADVAQSFRDTYTADSSELTRAQEDYRASVQAVRDLNEEDPLEVTNAASQARALADALAADPSVATGAVTAAEEAAVEAEAAAAALEDG